jgi:dTDP-glucose 4,6-dehydratase
MRLLVTGGAGFIGSALVRHAVLARGWQVMTLDALTYAGHLSSLGAAAGHANHCFVKADVADMEAISAAFAAHDPDLVIHLAAESHVDRSIDSAADFVRTNVVGTFVMLEAARAHHARLSDERRGRFRFVHVSTDEVFGSLGDEGLFKEDTPYDPRSPYSASKAASDHLASAWFHTHGLPVCISNCSNNYGPYQLPEKLIPLTILNALEGRPLPVYGAGTNVRDWLYVDDHVTALLAVAERGVPGQSYNVGGLNERRNIDVVHAICRALDDAAPKSHPHADLITHVADRPGHDQRYAIDATKISRELGWRPAESFETGLVRTVRWYLDNEDWWRPLRGHGAQRLGLRSEAPRKEGA